MDFDRDLKRWLLAPTACVLAIFAASILIVLLDGSRSPWLLLAALAIFVCGAASLVATFFAIYDLLAQRARLTAKNIAFLTVGIIPAVIVVLWLCGAAGWLDG